MFDPHQVNLYQPPASSHKGQNGKLLVIGGSRLFHSSIFWSADVAGKVVDLVHLTSPANENNQIFRKRLKEKFWNGIVVDWTDVENYIEEDDCILIGPGMVRSKEATIEDRRLKIGAEDRESKIEKSDPSSTFHPLSLPSILHHLPSFELEQWGKEDKTDKIVNYLLKKYPTKKWVLDGGGLQEVDPKLITGSCILTPHKKEFLNLADKSYKNYKDYKLADLSKKLDNCTILLKGPTDIVCQGKRCVSIKGGNPGLTKGGTGDVLAGLVAALYCKNDAWTATTVGSWANKKAGDELYKKVGPYFNAADLVKEIPNVLVKV